MYNFKLLIISLFIISSRFNFKQVILYYMDIGCYSLIYNYYYCENYIILIFMLKKKKINIFKCRFFKNIVFGVISNITK